MLTFILTQIWACKNYAWDLHRRNHIKTKALHNFFNFNSNHSISEHKDLNGMLQISSQPGTQNFGKSQNGGHLNRPKNYIP